MDKKEIYKDNKKSPEEIFLFAGYLFFFFGSISLFRNLGAIFNYMF